MDETFEDLKKSLADKDIQTKEITYDFDGKSYKATFCYDAAKEGERPAIIVLPEWWGLNDYVKNRAKMFAALGYATMALDVFGNGDTANNPTEAMAFIKPYNDDPALAREIVHAAIEKLKTFPQVDSSRLALAGYCFGGYAAINAGVHGADVKAVVAFHPSLGGIQPEKGIQAKFLICHGENDEFEKDNVAPFKKAMDEAGIDYVFKDYANSKHAFTSPKADEMGKEFNIPVGYNAEADSASWKDAKAFLGENL